MHPEVWTIRDLLRWTTDRFTQCGIETPRLDAEVLLAHALKTTRLHLYTHHDQPVGTEERALFRNAVLRRTQHEPVAYLLGYKEFFGREFVVNSSVLIPRPETEHVIEQTLEWAEIQQDPCIRIADIGCGSGAIGVTLACELPMARVTLVDISQSALNTAIDNAHRLGVADRVEGVCADLCTSLHGAYDAIVSNPPYIADAEVLPVDVQDFEPSLALRGGEKGYEILHRLCLDARKVLRDGGLLACEVGAGQATELQQFMADLGFRDCRCTKDLAGIDRVTTGIWFN